MQRPEAGGRSPLEHALTIPGAEQVALIATDGPSVAWWAGNRAPAPDEATAVVGLALAAGGVVRLADPDDDLGDLLLISGAAFHLFRLIRSASGQSLVAHLTLRRGGANLAMARHEFKVLTERYAVGSGPPPRQAAAAPGPASTSPVVPPASTAGEPVAAEGGMAPLPRRRPGAGPNRPPTASGDGNLPANWLVLFGQPFATDEAVLERLLGELRHL